MFALLVQFLKETTGKTTLSTILTHNVLQLNNIAELNLQLVISS